MLKNIYLLLALFWSFSILFLCLASFSNLPNTGLEDADKYVHFTFHFVFVNLWFIYFYNKNRAFNSKQVLVIFFVSFLFGILIELLQQALTATRSGDVFDILANASGALTALTLILVYQFLKKRNQKFYKIK